MGRGYQESAVDLTAEFSSAVRYGTVVLPLKIARKGVVVVAVGVVIPVVMITVAVAVAAAVNDRTKKPLIASSYND